MCFEESEKALTAITSSRLVISYIKKNQNLIINSIIDKMLTSNNILYDKLNNKDTLLNFKESLVKTDFEWMIDYTNLPNMEIHNLDKKRLEYHYDDLSLIYFHFFKNLSEYIQNETFQYDVVKRKINSLIDKLLKNYP